MTDESKDFAVRVATRICEALNQVAPVFTEKSIGEIAELINEENVNEWVDCDERVPEWRDGDKSGGVQVAYCGKKGCYQRTSSWGAVESNLAITHWRRSFPPPKNRGRKDAKIGSD